MRLNSINRNSARYADTVFLADNNGEITRNWCCKSAVWQDRYKYVKRKKKQGHWFKVKQNKRKQI